MDQSYWQKQTKEKPLFPDIIWSRPEQKSQAGKLLIVGGNLHSIVAPNLAYSEALKQRVGECKVVLPEKAKKLFGGHIPENIEFCISTPSGSFSQEALDEIKSYTSWADATLLASDFGNNSETAILLEKISSLPGVQIYAQDALDPFVKHPQTLLNRPDTLLVLDFSRLQKYISASGFSRALTSNIGLVGLVSLLHETSIKHNCTILTTLEKIVCTSHKGQVITTPIEYATDYTKLSATAAIWWLQNPAKPLEAIVSSVVNLK